MSDLRRSTNVTVEHWKLDNTYTVRWGPASIDAWYGFQNKSLALLIADALARGIQIGERRNAFGA